ncbi:MAG: glutamine-hydrolyzing carbamoyl-phosphate synthase small subunit [Clostridia bacterium]|nr:glutamine-hydrolyzing carbamoyl-phosphate synthase small subunit [Clostridia bacterium]
MENQMRIKLVLEDGSEYPGYSFGDANVIDRVCTVVFNTSMVGYQEIVSDPAYTDQFVVMTYTLIGNYGMTEEDYESKSLTIGGLIVREYNDQPSNFRYTKTLEEVMCEHHIPGLWGIDTRMLTRKLRGCGSMRGVLTSMETSTEAALLMIRTTPVPTDAVSRVSCKKRWYTRTANAKYNVVAIDCGMKTNIVRTLTSKGCNVTVVPYNTTPEQIDALKPDGVIVSSGPGCPEHAAEVIACVKALWGKYPIFGIGLGCQILCLAKGATVSALPHGHRGGYPVRCCEDGKITSTAQNHTYAINRESLDGTGLSVLYENVTDLSVEGVIDAESRVLGVQFAPESAPGPQDNYQLFDRFVAMM